jgi:glycosyltransferase involved in cell wall biosynthesis
MKLVIQIPCHNEEATLGVTLAALPKALPGFSSVEWLVIDDGSQDETVAVAKRHGVRHIVRFTRHQGLAAAFTAGLEASLSAGADVIVNTDADNQYCADDIPALIAPILSGKADIVVGARPINSIAHFSPIKKVLQRLGSWAVRLASNADVPDAPSGFRAMSRRAAMQLNVFSEYTYTLETIIQAGQKRMAIASVPIRVNGELRPSRLVKSIPSYVRRSIVVIARIFVTYRPFAAFGALATLALVPGLLLAGRFLWLYVTGNGAGHVQSVVLSALLLGSALFLLIVGVVVDLISVNRKLLERIELRLRRIELDSTLTTTESVVTRRRIAS